MIPRILFLILVVVILGAVAYWIRNEYLLLKNMSFSSHQQKGFKEKDRNVSYSGDQVFNLLVISEFKDDEKQRVDGFTVISLDPYAKTALVVSINPDVYFSTYSGEYTDIAKFEDLMVIGSLQNPPQPISYPYYEIERLLAMPMDGYVYLEDGLLNDLNGSVGYSDLEQDLSQADSYSDWSDSWNQYWIDFFGSMNILKSWRYKDEISRIKTNMSSVDMYKFISDFRSVGEQEVISVTIDDDLLDDSVNDRGEVVKSVSESTVDHVLSNYCSDIRFDREQARIEIFNGTSVNGLGGEYSRWIKHLGGDVIRIDNAPGVWNETVIYTTDEDEFSYTLEKINSIWDGDVEIVQDRPDFVTTGDVIVVIGEDKAL